MIGMYGDSLDTDGQKQQVEEITSMSQIAGW